MSSNASSHLSGIIDSAEEGIHMKAHSADGKKRQKPARKSSFQHAKTAIMQRTERMRRRSVGKVQPLQESLAQLNLPKPQTSPDLRRFKALPENDDDSECE